MEIEVAYEDWLVGDGEPEVKVGDRWSPRIELQRLGAAPPEGWHPEVAPADGRDQVLTRLPDASCAYSFVATPVYVGGWTVLSARGVRFAAPGEHHGLVSGRGVFNHDTYFISETGVLEALRQQLVVTHVGWERARYRRDGVELHLLGYDPVEEVGSTFAFKRSRRSAHHGRFVVTCSAA